MRYRQYPQDVFSILNTLMRFFECAPCETTKTFYRFNVIVLCDALAHEQFTLALVDTKERNFMTQGGLDRITENLTLANEFNKVLFHLDFAKNFKAVRVQRDNM
jgi:hypothetical protein